MRITLFFLFSLNFTFTFINSSIVGNVQSNYTIIPIFDLPKCNSDADCSYKGSCDIPKGKCNCNNGMTTYISPRIISKVNTRPENKISDKVNTTNGNFTIFYQPVHLTIDDIKYCNYEEKKQLTAFLLSLLVGFGSEHFYLENYKLGVSKLVFTVFCCGFNIVYFIIYKFMKNSHKYIEFIGTFEAFYLSCGFFYMILWTIHDCVFIGFNAISDGYGMHMRPWNSTE